MNPQILESVFYPHPQGKRMSISQRKWLTGSNTPVIVGALTLLAALLRFYLIGDKTVWLDEAFSIWLARQSLGEMWGWLARIDQHPPLYYTLLHGWIGLFGDLQGPVRGLSALCSTLAVPLFYAGVRRLVDRPTALIAVFILAISPFHVRFAQETRMYGLLTLAVAAALYCVAVILHERNAPRRVWWGLAVSQAAVMLTHNTAAVYFPLALNLAVGVILSNAKMTPLQKAKERTAETRGARRARGDFLLNSAAFPPRTPRLRGE
ncbi:MAG: glycosyltransferase family 39 protein, partial [Chloroflexi bacterium]|nr:glycosyltransferase family 39 protein [Chloroflexota bacterium]